MVDPSKDSVAEPKPSPAIPQNPEPSRDLESGRPSTLIDRDDEKAQTDIMPNPAPPILTTAQDWTGPDDPENPMNWPLAQRIYHTTIPALFNFIVTFSSGVYAPDVDAIAKRFDVSATVSLLGLSLYVLGLGFGPILAAPLSETFGRRVVYSCRCRSRVCSSSAPGLRRTSPRWRFVTFWRASLGRRRWPWGRGRMRIFGRRL